MIASGDLICLEGMTCIGWWMLESIPSREFEPRQRFPPFQEAG